MSSDVKAMVRTLRADARDHYKQSVASDKAADALERVIKPNGQVARGRTIRTIKPRTVERPKNGTIAFTVLDAIEQYRDPITVKDMHVLLKKKLTEQQVASTLTNLVCHGFAVSNKQEGYGKTVYQAICQRSDKA